MVTVDIPMVIVTHNEIVCMLLWGYLKKKLVHVLPNLTYGSDEHSIVIFIYTDGLSNDFFAKM